MEVVMMIKARSKHNGLYGMVSRVVRLSRGVHVGQSYEGFIIHNIWLYPDPDDWPVVVLMPMYNGVTYEGLLEARWQRDHIRWHEDPWCVDRLDLDWEVVSWLKEGF